MNRSTHTPDNLFLRCYANLGKLRLKLPGTLLALCLSPLLALFLLMLWFGLFQLQRDTAQQADAVGNDLARQIASSVGEPLTANDHLSLNILLAQWNQSPLIAHLSLYSTDNRIVAEAGNKPTADNQAPGKGRFVATVYVQDEAAGQLHLTLAAAPFKAPASALLRHLSWSLLLLALISALLAWRLALGQRKDLHALGNWYGDSDKPAPGLQRPDEIGDLARRLAQRRIIDLPIEDIPAEPEEQEISIPDEPMLVTEPIEAEPPLQAEETDTSTEEGVVETVTEREPEATKAPLGDAEAPQTDDEQPIQAATEPTQPEWPLSTILAVRLGNLEALRRLPRPRLLTILERYREHLEQACVHYAGTLRTLHDGTSLLIFKPEQDNLEELTQALCCGELLRVLGHDLQIAIADTGIALHLQIALCQAALPDNLSDEQLSEQEDCRQVLEQVQHSRNLVLLDAELAGSPQIKERALVRRLASQPGIYCVERLADPYQSLLEKQLGAFYAQPRH